VREKGFAGKSFFWFGDEGMLREFIALAPEMKIKVNAGDIERLKYWQNICTPSYVEIAPEKITEVFRTYCHQHNIKVMAACQEDDTSQFQLVIDKKADLVNLDRPEVFVRLLPSWGLYLRHIRNIKLKDIQLKLVDEDFRPAIVDEDVEGLTTDRILLYP
jgi:hypothetical protein